MEQDVTRALRREEKITLALRALYEQYGAVCAPTLLFTNALAEALEGEFPDFRCTE